MNDSDYNNIAVCFRMTRPDPDFMVETGQWRVNVIELACMFEIGDSDFNKDSFLEVCQWTLPTYRGLEAST